MVQSLVAGALIALITPIIGVFLVLRRYSLIADTLAHVSFAGVALGAFLGVSPVYTALGATVVAAVGIERVRVSTKLFGESALALFLSASLAFAAVLLSITKTQSVNLFQYLFGSIVTVQPSDLLSLALAGLVLVVVCGLFYKEFLYLAYDERSAQVSGLPVGRLNALFIVLCAVVIALSIPIVGVLLVAALVVIPALVALDWGRRLLPTICIAEAVSLIGVLSGIVISFYANTATGGTIVLVLVFIFILSATLRRGYKS